MRTCGDQYRDEMKCVQITGSGAERSKYKIADKGGVKDECRSSRILNIIVSVNTLIEKD